MSWITAFLRWTARRDGKDWSPSSRPNINIRRPVEGWSLENIPVEIVQEVAIYLTPIELVILALTSKTMLHRLGPRVLKVKNINTRHALLEAFSERGMFLPEVLCPFCNIFHSPLPVYDRGNIRIRKCQLPSNPWGHGESPYLPVQISFNTVAGVIRCHQYNKSTLFPPDTLASSNEINKDSFKIHTYNDVRIVEGHLILRTEKLVLPLQNASNKLEAVSQLCRFLHQNTRNMDKCCHHTTWSSTYPTLLESIPSKSYQVLDDLLNNKHRYTHSCVWTHALPCSEKSGTHALLQDWNFIVHSCRHCSTDFSLAMIDVPNKQRRVCILTAWKDLGAGKSPQGTEWLSHLYPNLGGNGHPFEHRTGWRRVYEPPRLSPEVYRKFEGIDESIGAYQYKPMIAQKKFIRLMDRKA